MKIKQEEVLRYLGYGKKQADEKILHRITESSEELLNAVVPRRVTKEVSVSFLQEDTIQLGELVVTSKNLAEHLSGCKKAILLAATLGPQPDLLIQRYACVSMSHAVILQACAAALIEDYSDEYEKFIKEQEGKKGLYLRPRYSPGYGDFSLTYQKALVTVLDASKKIGLTVTESLMLAPSKSITAVMGLTVEEKSCHISRCMECQAKNCPFRKE